MLSAQSLHQAVEMQTKMAPDATAVQFGEVSVSYRELNAQANRLARLLIEQGIERTVVALQMERSTERVVAMLAVLKTGSCYLPLSPEQPPERTWQLLHDAQPACLLVQPGKATEPHPVPVIGVELQKNTNPVTSDPDLSTKPEDLAYIMYTSGSSGRPKGVLISHAAILNRICWMKDYLHIQPDDRILHKTPYTFDVSVWEIFLPLMSGSTLVLAKPGGEFDPRYLSETMRSKKIAYLHFVPSMLGHFLNGTAPQPYPELKAVICSGEVLPPAMVEQFYQRFSAGLFNLYGPTEAAIDVTAYRCPKNQRLHRVPIGKAIRGIRLHIIDKNGNEIPGNEPGQLAIAGIGLANGYLNRPDLTDQAFVANRFSPHFSKKLYLTGDRVQRNKEGQIVYLGRMDHQIKLRGYRIEPDEITFHLNQMETVHQSVVLKIEPELEEAFLLAAIEVASGREPDKEQLREYLKKKLPPYMVPTHFFFTRRLPTGASGKCDRHAIQTLYLARRKERNATRDQSSSHPVKAIWLRFLEMPAEKENISFEHTPFFALGGHSLLALRILHCYRKELGWNLSVPDFFEHPTVADQYNLYQKRTPTPTNKPAAPNTPTDEKYLPLNWEQTGICFFHFAYPFHAAYTIPVVYEVHGNPDPKTLEKCIRAVVNKHPSLRMKIIRTEDRFYMTEEQHIDGSLQVQHAQPGTHLQELITQIRKPFELLGGALFDVCLIKGSGTAKWVLFRFHHIHSDAWSLRLFFNDLRSALANTEKNPDAPTLSPATYLHHFKKIRQLLGVTRQSALNYWSETLDGAPQKIRFASNPTTPTHNASADLHIEIPDPEMHRAVKETAARLNCSPFQFYFAVFGVLLLRKSDENDLVVGVPVHLRELPEAAGLFGFFVRTLPLRIKTDKTPTFRTLLKQVQHQLYKGLKNRDVDMRSLASGKEGERHQSPFFNVIFNHYENYHVPLIHNHFSLTPFPTPVVHAKCDLKLVVVEEKEHVRCEWEFRQECFDKEQQHTYMQQFAHVLNGIVCDPEKSIYDYPLDPSAGHYRYF